MFASAFAVWLRRSSVPSSRRCLYGSVSQPGLSAYNPTVASNPITRIGSSLGRILDRLIAETGLKRVVLSGGDTSSHAALNLQIDALTSVAKLAPGGPLCRAHSKDPSRNGMEIAMKGGQVGAADYFVTARDGQ